MIFDRDAVPPELRLEVARLVGLLLSLGFSAEAVTHALPVVLAALLENGQVDARPARPH